MSSAVTVIRMTFPEAPGVFRPGEGREWLRPKVDWCTCQANGTRPGQFWAVIQTEKAQLTDYTPAVQLRSEASAMTGKSEKLGRASKREAIKRLSHLLASLFPLLLVQGTSVAGSELMPVRTVTAESSNFTREIRLTGAIQARFRTNLSFRISGRIKSRAVETGDHVTADQVLATLDPPDQKAELDAARAAVASAKAVLVQVKANFERQRTLLAQGFTPRSVYDQAKTSFDTATGRLDSARASLKTAEDQLSYTELRPGATGIIVERSAEVGEVVRPGKPVFTLAQDGPRDAVFDVHESLLANRARVTSIEIALQANPAVKTTATVREVSPSVDAKSGTVRVKLALTNTPREMTLGAPVVGTAMIRGDEAIVLPWTALYERDGAPAVWIVGGDNRVQPKSVSIEAFATKELVLSGGVKPGEKVVTAGIQFLRPGQKVAVVNGDAQ
jgi:membrane fusion protein, multidrug efflux system